jgi:hypothetical protein
MQRFAAREHNLPAAPAVPAAVPSVPPSYPPFRTAIGASWRSARQASHEHPAGRHRTAGFLAAATGESGRQGGRGGERRP